MIYYNFKKYRLRFRFNKCPNQIFLASFFHSLIESLSKMRRPWSVLSFSYPLSNNICNFCLSYLLMGFTCYRQTVIISLLSLDVLCLTLIKSSSFRLISLFLSFTFHLFFLCLLRFPMENLS